MTDHSPQAEEATEPPEVDATPDEAFELGRVRGYAGVIEERGEVDRA